MKHRRGLSQGKLGSIGVWLALSSAASACAVATKPVYEDDLDASGGQPSSNANGGDEADGGRASVGQGGTTSSAGTAGTLSSAGMMSSSTAGSASGGSPSGGSHAGGASGASSNAGGTSSAGTTSSSGGSASGGAPSGGSHGVGDPWTFDSSLQGWAVRDHSANITTMPTATGGVASFADLPFSMASEYSDFALSFDSDVNLSGLTLHAKIRRVSGGFVGAQVYAYGGAWSGGTFTSLNTASFQDVVLSVPSAGSGFDPTKVSRIGIKLNTGSNASNTFSSTTIEIDEVTVE